MGNWPHLALLALLMVLLLAAGIEDARTREIANGKNLAIALLAPLWWWASGLSPWPGVVLQLGVAAAVFGLFVLAFHFGQMGGGDVKMIGALALWIPPLPLLWVLAVMSILGGALTVVMLIDSHIVGRGRRIEVPYGVAIAAAALLWLPQTDI